MKVGSVLVPALTVGGMALVSSFAFSRNVREVIGERDNWTCADCGKDRQHGWRLDAAHYDHDRRNSYYNIPENGRMLDLLCHLRESVIDHDDIFAAQQIINRAWRHGLHYEWVYQYDPDYLKDDRIAVVMAIDQLGIGRWVTTPAV